MAMNPNTQMLRSIISELRRASTGSLGDNPLFRYIMGQYRRNQTTQEQICKAREEMQFLANTYLCYLRSSRLQKEISEEFHGKGERTIAETAKMVGFKLPHDPK
ncbi:PREDICTED: UPF0562 protein C7orf55 homolog [Nicrophorus vespilloides]|uniref:Protein FMC1 homolog n=1 Tax=Nicrophorus vespilloides TaxID=110193 RepID=A0ABM1N922_NICVS|nr:PREDICTED: UPF0562 protein C7orf55 homolog [Nicrophorus vespilloides]